MTDYRWLLPIAMLALLTVPLEAAEKNSTPQEVLDWCSQMAGKEYWLRTDVIRVQGLRATDATNVFPDGRVYHQGTISKGTQITSQTPTEFTDEARRKLGYDKEQNEATILRIDKGARVYVHAIEAKGQEVKVEITLKGSWYSEINSTVRLKFDEGYSLDDLKASFNVAFAAEEYQIKHADKTDEVSVGMSLDAVVRTFGYADKQIVLNGKTILVYDSIKLVFVDGKLSDVQ